MSRRLFSFGRRRAWRRVLAGAWLLLNASGGLAQTPTGAAAPTLGAAETAAWTDGAEAAARYADPRWELAWADEFDGTGLPDVAKWRQESGLVRNREAQFYTVGRLENLAQRDGYLVLTARREPWEGAAYTSASVRTDGRFTMRYGKIEFRAKVPTGRGVWPALWMMGLDPEGRRWPVGGEIDLMEFVGWQPDRFHFTVHTEAFNHVKRTHRGTFRQLARPEAEFHRFGLIWTPERLEWFFDGEKVFEFRNTGGGRAEWPFDNPHFLLINLAIGGAWGGAKGIDDAIFPVEFLVDYVRVWRSPAASGP